MFDLFSKKETKQSEPEFITGGQFSFYLEKLLSEANQFITIVSPYIRFSQRIYDCLQQKKNTGVMITIIYREPFIHPEIAQKIYQRSNLHAKCYITENGLILGSMNLYDVSLTNNAEFGIFLSKADYPTTYEKVYAEIERLSHTYNGKSLSNEQPPVQKKQSSNPTTLERKRRYSQETVETIRGREGSLLNDRRIPSILD